jgi:hypothetical protein
MSQPVSPVPLGWPENSVIWCVSCQIHLALASQPLCPSCLDERVKEMKGP